MENLSGMLLLALGSALFFCFLGAWIAKQKGRSTGEGGLLGFLFGPLGVLVAAVLPTAPKRDVEPRRRMVPVAGPGGEVLYREIVEVEQSPSPTQQPHRESRPLLVLLLVVLVALTVAVAFVFMSPR